MYFIVNATAGVNSSIYSSFEQIKSDYNIPEEDYKKILDEPFPNIVKDFWQHCNEVIDRLNRYLNVREFESVTGDFKFTIVDDVFLEEHRYDTNKIKMFVREGN